MGVGIMNETMIIAVAAAVLPLPALAIETGLDAHDQWPQWRGPLGTGVAPQGDPPIQWSEDKNIRWKIAIPGQGHATPIIWGPHVFITTAVPIGGPMPDQRGHAPGAHDNVPAAYRLEFMVLAVNRSDGGIARQHSVRSERPHEGVHETGSWASSSTLTDGEHLFAYFGSRGLYCLDMDGKPVWGKHFGDMHTLHGHGEGSPPGRVSRAFLPGQSDVAHPNRDTLGG